MVQADSVTTGHPENSCPLYNAHYRPHPVYEKYKSDYEFELSIGKSERKPGTSGPEPAFYYQITMYDRRSGERLSRISLGYFCTMGVPTCSAVAGDDPRIGAGISVHVLDLNRDLSPYWDTVPRNQYGYDYRAPYALVFPYVGAWFYRVDWTKMKKDIVYYSAKHVHPDLQERDVWVFTACDEKGD